MKKPQKKNKKNKEELNTENELLKLKMMAEFGGNFMGNDEIPPEVENKFLKQITKFHKLQENASLIQVYKFIGEPEYDHVNDLSDKQVRSALRKIVRLLIKHQIVVEVLSEVSEREFYRFITEELFKQEVQNIRMKGWMTQFIYEDFHPNDEYDVKSAAKDITNLIFNKGSMFFEPLFSEEMKDSIGLSMEREDFQHKVEAFWGQYHNVKLADYEITSLLFSNEKSIATITCNVSYKTQTAKGRRYKNEETQAEYIFEKDTIVNGVWVLKQVISNVL
jgi:hypothetical protein